MNFKYLNKKLIFLTLFLFYTSLLFAQTTKVSGVVTDASNKQPLPYVTVSFQGSTIGAATDNNGRYSISTTNSYNHIKISFVGYKDAVLPIVASKEQVINVKLTPV